MVDNELFDDLLGKVDKIKDEFLRRQLRNNQESAARQVLTDDTQRSPTPEELAKERLNTDEKQLLSTIIDEFAAKERQQPLTQAEKDEIWKKMWSDPSNLESKTAAQQNLEVEGFSFPKLKGQSFNVNADRMPTARRNEPVRTEPVTFDVEKITGQTLFRFTRIEKDGQVRWELSRVSSDGQISVEIRSSGVTTQFKSIREVPAVLPVTSEMEIFLRWQGGDTQEHIKVLITAQNQIAIGGKREKIEEDRLKKVV